MMAVPQILAGIGQAIEAQLRGRFRDRSTPHCDWPRSTLLCVSDAASSGRCTDGSAVTCEFLPQEEPRCHPTSTACGSSSAFG